MLLCDFARTKGAKDKKKRKQRVKDASIYAGIGGVSGLGGIGIFDPTESKRRLKLRLLKDDLFSDKDKLKTINMELDKQKKYLSSLDKRIQTETGEKLKKTKYYKELVTDDIKEQTNYKNEINNRINKTNKILDTIKKTPKKAKIARSLKSFGKGAAIGLGFYGLKAIADRLKGK